MCAYKPIIIKTATIDDLVMIDALIDKYYTNQEQIKENEQVEFKKLDQ